MELPIVTEHPTPREWRETHTGKIRCRKTMAGSARDVPEEFHFSNRTHSVWAEESANMAATNTTATTCLILASKVSFIFVLKLHVLFPYAILFIDAVFCMITLLLWENSICIDGLLKGTIEWVLLEFQDSIMFIMFVSTKNVFYNWILGLFADDMSCDPKMAAICGMHLVSDLLSMKQTDCGWVNFIWLFYNLYYLPPDTMQYQFFSRHTHLFQKFTNFLFTEKWRNRWDACIITPLSVCPATTNKCTSTRFNWPPLHSWCSATRSRRCASVDVVSYWPIQTWFRTHSYRGIKSVCRFYQLDTFLYTRNFRTCFINWTHFYMLFPDMLLAVCFSLYR